MNGFGGIREVISAQIFAANIFAQYSKYLVNIHKLARMVKTEYSQLRIAKCSQTGKFLELQLEIEHMGGGWGPLILQNPNKKLTK